MKNYYIKKLIALIIVLSMIISDIPVFRLDIKAESENKPNEVITTPSPESVENEQETGTDFDDEIKVHILEEDVSLRDEVTKYFKMSDGSMKVCVYPQAVHYLDNGEYLDIDNTLEYVQVESINIEEETDEIIDKVPLQTEEPGIGVTVEETISSTEEVVEEDEEVLSEAVEVVDNELPTTEVSLEEPLNTAVEVKETDSSVIEVETNDTEEIVTEAIDEAGIENTSSEDNNIEEADISELNSSRSNKFEKKKNHNREKPERKGAYYKNKSNSFTVNLPAEYGTDYIEFADESGFVSFKLIETDKKPMKNEAAMSVDENDKTAARAVNDKGSYKSIKKDVDLEYDVSGNMLKETIVLNKKTKEDFVFEIKTSADSVALNEDGSVSFYDENNNKLYVISAPYMSDAKGEYTSKVEVELSEGAEGYLLTYKPDEEWLYDENREYPVRIDPTMVKALYDDNIYDTYVASYQNATYPDIWGNVDVLTVGARADGTINRALIRFDIPNEIGKTDCIVDAKLHLVHNFAYNDEIVDGIQIDVHELNKDSSGNAFSEGGTYWLNQPTYDSTIIDYAIVDKERYLSDTTVAYDSYNITELANKWHNGEENNGLLLKLHDEDYEPEGSEDDKEVYYFATESLYYGDVTRYIEITYRNTLGLENYWAYSAASAKRAGTGYVNLYNGNQIFVHNDVTNSTLINGFTLSHVYNGGVAEEDYSDNDKEYFGVGWRLNLTQTLVPVGELNVPGNSAVRFIYTDGDGTRHYLVETDGKIVDEDGLGLTYTSISEDNLIYQLETQDGTIMKFDRWTDLRQIIDKNGNYVKLNYSPIEGVDNYLTQIETSSGDTFGLHYDTDYVLDYIVDKAGRKTHYNYDGNNRLISITYEDKTTSTYQYTVNTGRLSSVREAGTGGINYSHNANGRVVLTYCVGKSEAAGSYASYTYDYCQTTVTDNDGYKLTYQFDSFGRNTCIYDSEGNICSYSFTENSNDIDSIFNNNKTNIDAKGTIYTENLLKNGTFVSDTSNWWFNTITGTVVDNQSLISPKTIKIEADTVDNNLLVQNISNATSGTYTLSAYVKGTVTSGTGGIGVRIVTNNGLSAKSEYITGTIDEITDNGFVRVSATLTLSEGDSINRVEAGLFSASGTVYIDSVQLEKSDTASPINLIENSSFEIIGNGAINAYGFTKSSGMSGGRYTSAALDASISDGGARGFLITGFADKSCNANQTMAISGTKGDAYSFGGWAKAPSAEAHSENIPFALKLTFNNTDETTTEEYVKYNTAVNEWQFKNRTVIATKDYDSLSISLEYNNNVNTAYFDCVFLYRDTAASYTYENEGNVISTSDFAAQQSEYQYSGNNLTKLVEPTGISFEYFYDNKDNLISSKSSDGLQNIITTNTNGNVEKVRVSAGKDSAAIQNGETYYIRLKGSAKYLTVDSTDTTGEINVTQEAYSGSSYQQWTIKQTADGYYLLHPVCNTNKSLDVVQALDTEGTNIIIWNTHEGNGQKFKVEPQSDYTYKIKPKCTKTEKVVSVLTPASQDNVTLSATTSSDSNSWYFENVDEAPVTSVESGKVYRIRAYNSGKYVDVKNKSSVVGTHVNQYELKYGENQYFYFTEYNDSGYYYIRPIYTSNKIAVSDDYSSINTSYKYLCLSDGTVTDNKLFKLEYDTSTNKGFQIIPKSDETKALVVANGSKANNAELIFTTKTSEDNSYFLLEECSKEIVTKATYTSNGEYVKTTTDARGKVTNYTYNEDTDLLETITDPKGNVTTYSYNQSNDRLLSVNTGSSTVNYTYLNNGAVDTITSPGGTNYKFNYDNYGRTTSIVAGGRTLGTYTYKNNYSGLMSRFDYGNGAYKTYEYDALNRPVKETAYDTGMGAVSKTYKYDKLGNLTELKSGSLVTKYNYDLSGRLTSFTDSAGYSVSSIYDNYNRVSSSLYKSKKGTTTTTYSYGDKAENNLKTGLIYSVDYGTGRSIFYNYDDLNRKSAKVISGNGLPARQTYTYISGAGLNGTTSLVSANELYIAGIKRFAYDYYYDNNGNIIRIDKDDVNINQYTYDALGQLSASYDGTSYYSYSYDESGNILSVTKDNTVIKTYSYADANWSDLLTAYNGETITYDEIGNPLQYRDGMVLDWRNGRNLICIDNNEDIYVEYGYNADGYRTLKRTDNTVTTYKYINGVLMSEITGSEEMVYLYDENGSIAGFSILNGTERTNYYYIKNIQQDVIGILDDFGLLIVEYSYDDWGNVISISGNKATEIGEKNPIRYRSYYYDNETGFYYLLSRYYDPETGRFLNADGYVSTGTGLRGYNLFSYSNNNPIMMCDNAGTRPVVGTSIEYETSLERAISFASMNNYVYEAREDLANAPDLNIVMSSKTSYNCYGNGLNKQIVTNPTGYLRGDSTYETFLAVQSDLGGKANCVKLDSIDEEILDGWYKVAMKCGETDYHFIRLDGDKWYNKSGTKPGLYIDESKVTAGFWKSIWWEDGQPKEGNTIYTDETIYFAVRIGWDE